MDFDLSFVFGLVVTGTLIAMASLLAVTALTSRNQPGVMSIFGESTPSTVLLFDGESLVDATPSARALVAQGMESGGAWFKTMSKLEPIFPGLSLRMTGLQREGRFVLCSREDINPPLVLRAESVGGLTRLTLIDADSDQRHPVRDNASDLAIQDELTTLRQTLSRAPILIWRERPDGTVIWANTAYLSTAADLLEPGKELSWPLPLVFPAAEVASAQSADPHAAVRRSVRIGDRTQWYEITALPDGTDRLLYALPVNKLVQSEANLREFMQTLTKTFAQLPIGLAIFDRNRVLQMFNPALIDLAGLPAEFLISRPTLATFLDAMREKSMIPEPKDYRSWRKQIIALEEAAASGLFEETWTLPSGQTYRVSGRPHPNGALAFQFEDISNEMMRTRRYRADLELGQAVIDAMDAAIAVFSQDGSLVMSNKAHGRLWKQTTIDTFPHTDIADAISVWRGLSAPTLLWNDLTDFVGTVGDREPWEGEIRLVDGRLVSCKISPLPQGSTLIAFAPLRPTAEPTADPVVEQAMLIA